MEMQPQNVKELPDAAFALIRASAGETSGIGGVVVMPQTRFFPHHDNSVVDPMEAKSLDLEQLRNSIALLNETELSEEEFKIASEHLYAHTEQLGISGVPIEVPVAAFAVDIASVKLNEQQVQIVEIMKASKGTHPMYGELEITRSHLKLFLENFNNKARKIDIAIDFAHENEKIAAGWVKSVWLSEDSNSLWAEIRWTTEGAKAIQDRLYRYFSPEFTFNYVDAQGKSWGPVLLGGGLTNRPFLKDLMPLIQLNEGKHKTQIESKKNMSDVIKLQEQLLASKSEKESIAVKLSEKEKEVLSLSEKVIAVEIENKKLTSMIELSEKKATFEKALSEGKFVEAQREILMTLPCDTMKKLAELATPVLNLDARGSSNDTSAKTLSDAELKFAAKLGVSAEEFTKYNA